MSSPASAGSQPAPLRIERSPHPYHRRSVDLKQAPLLATLQNENANASLAAGTTPSPDGNHSDAWAKRSGVLHSGSMSPSESGTEADDEAGVLARALPAPPWRPRKGLRGGRDELLEETTQTVTPGVEASLLFAPLKAKSLEQPRFRQTRAAELLRRVCEVALVSAIGASVASSRWSGGGLSWPRELDWHVAIVPLACLMHVARLLATPLMRTRTWRLGKVSIPTSFDPAPMLYPTLVPCLVSMSMSDDETILMANSILGLACIPPVLVPHVGASFDFNTLHWIISLLPTLRENRRSEMLAVLYPLFVTLLPAVYFVTTSSLLRSELRLLAVSLVNLVCFARSPQIRILTYILWIGGVGLFVFCMHILRWNVALERIPRWRLQRAVGLVKASNAFVSTLWAGLNLSTKIKDDLNEELATIDEIPMKNHGLDGQTGLRGRAERSSFSMADSHQVQNARASVRKTSEPVNHARKRSSTTSNIEPLAAAKTSKAPKRRMSTSSLSRIYLSMTPRQAELTKWLYAAYTFTVLAVLVLGPVRYFIAVGALQGLDPFGWAIGYLFGGIDPLRLFVLENNLEGWIQLAPQDNPSPIGLVDTLRNSYFGVANTRLLLFGYWATVIAAGVTTVLTLDKSVEVDTRRKIFHGMMVIMLLPAGYIDPALLALGLALVLSVFLLLDLIRASQLRPLSAPLARFLQPYVDGRDLRGPVVISHIFLLIGCAIPYWLSLAALRRTGTGPWAGWEFETRDVSMVAGVICVGMGDAAASLVGRRIGRHKWPWPGGKSLEGSAAFAVAVTVGLVLAKAWLVFGGWRQTWENGDAWSTVLLKAVLASCGASFTEAVLTGCNDNVVVPVILWLLVRGLRI